jgi:hypothetical protein
MLSEFGKGVEVLETATSGISVVDLRDGSGVRVETGKGTNSVERGRN